MPDACRHSDGENSMKQESGLGATEMRSMALHLRMMRLLGPLSLHCLEELLARAQLRHYDPGARFPVSAPGRRYHLLVLEGRVRVGRESTDNKPDDTAGETTLTASDAVYDYVPLLFAPDEPLTVTAVTASRCLLLDADLADRMLGAGAAQDDPWQCRKIA
jgi:hypothetical protein